MITGQQSKIARVLCGLKTTKDVSHFLDIAPNSYSGWESGSKSLSPATIEKARIFFENRGVRFIEDRSADKADALTRTFIGRDGFRLFMDEVYYAAVNGCTDFRIQNARPENWSKHLGVDWYSMHAKRMRDYSDQISFKITFCEGDTNQIAGRFAEYRWVKKEHFADQSIYLFADYAAFMTFTDDDVKIVTIRSTDIARALTLTFDFFWEHNTITPPDKGVRAHET